MNDPDDTLEVPVAPDTIPAPPPSVEPSGVHTVDRWLRDPVVRAIRDTYAPPPDTDLTMALDDTALDEE